MKRKMAVLLAVVSLTAFLAACQRSGGDDSSTPSSTESSATTTTTETSTTVTTTTTAKPIEPMGYGYSIDSVNVRTGPGTEYRGIGGLYYGERVLILAREGNWYQIQFGDGVGYVSADYIQANKPEAKPTQTPSTSRTFGTLNNPTTAATTTTTAASATVTTSSDASTTAAAS